MKTLAIIGASYLQLPLVKKAKELGLRTICFAWADGAVCRDVADVFYPISVTEKEQILSVCRREQVDGVTTIASDVAVPTVAYVTARMGLVGNSEESARKSSDKFLMRAAFKSAGVSCPRFDVVDDTTDVVAVSETIGYPLIVKPVDRSGSAGVMEIDSPSGLDLAVRNAIACSFAKKAIVEQCVTNMHEVSVEGFSFDGEYHMIQITDKVTTGAPHYVELGHHQPADLSDDMRHRIRAEVERGVGALGIAFGASHAELMITADDEIYMTEIGARMGGDFIGSDLVRLSTGCDLLKLVIDCALGRFDGITVGRHQRCSGVWFYAPETKWVKDEILASPRDRRIISCELQSEDVKTLTRSADRSGYFIYSGDSRWERKS